jgi:hypothetical protein
MTIKFKELTEEYNTPTEEVLSILLDYDKEFFESWRVYNDKLYPDTPIGERTISLPASQFDKIFQLLKPTIELVEIPEPVGNFIMENANGVMGNDGMYYHYADVCTLLKKYKKQK